MAKKNHFLLLAFPNQSFPLLSFSFAWPIAKFAELASQGEKSDPCPGHRAQRVLPAPLVLPGGQGGLPPPWRWGRLPLAVPWLQP